MKVDCHILVNSSVYYVSYQGEDTKKKVSNLTDQLGSYSAHISSLQANVGDVLLHINGKSYVNSDSLYIG